MVQVLRTVIQKTTVQKLFVLPTGGGIRTGKFEGPETARTVFDRKDRKNQGRAVVTVTFDDRTKRRDDPDREQLARLTAAVADNLPVDIALSKVGHVHERHTTAIEAEQEKVAGDGQGAGRKLGACNASQHRIVDGKFTGLLDTERNAPERIGAFGRGSFADGTVIDRPQLIQVERNRIGTQTFAQQELPELQDRGFVQFAELVVPLSRKTFEGLQRGTVGEGRAVATLAQQLLDLGTENRMHEAVVGTGTEQTRDIPPIEGSGAALQLRGDAVQLMYLMAKVIVDVVDETEVFADFQTRNGLAPRGVELGAKKLEGREDNAATTAAKDLDDQRIAVVGGILADVEHGFDSRFRHKQDLFVKTP